MTYADNAALGQDSLFVFRLGAALGVESLGRSDPLSDTILTQSATASADLFMPAVSSAPGFGDLYAGGGQEAISDGDLLAAVQASWERIAASVAGDTPPP